jgi:hypothetical protein
LQSFSSGVLGSKIEEMLHFLATLIGLLSVSAFAAETVVLKEGQTISEVLYEKKLEVGVKTKLYGKKSLVRTTLKMNPKLKPPKFLKPGTVLVIPDELVVKEAPVEPVIPEVIPEVLPEAEPVQLSTVTFRLGYVPTVFVLSETVKEGEISASPFVNPFGLYGSLAWKRLIHEVLGEVRLFGPNSSPKLGMMLDLSVAYQARINDWFSIGPIVTASRWQTSAFDVQNAFVSDQNKFTERDMKAIFGGARMCLEKLCLDFQKALSVDFGTGVKLRKASGDGSGSFMAASYAWSFYESWSLVPRFEQRKTESGNENVKNSLTSYSIGILKEF